LPPSVTGVSQNGDVSPDIRRDDRVYVLKLFDQAVFGQFITNIRES